MEQRTNRSKLCKETNIMETQKDIAAEKYFTPLSEISKEAKYYDIN